MVPHHSLLVTTFLSCLKASESLSNHFLFSIFVTPSRWRHLPLGHICLLFMWCRIAIRRFNSVNTALTCTTTPPKMVYNWSNPWQELSTGWFLCDICQSYCQLLCLCHIHVSRLWWRCLNGSVFRREIMFLLASDIISQTIRGDWCTKYSSPLSIRSISILGLWRSTSLESPISNCKMARVLVSINNPLDRLAENPFK